MNPIEAQQPTPQRTSGETEFKLVLANEAENHAFLTALPARTPRAAPALQINHLFDTPGARLAGRGLALRLRDEGGVWTLTAKGRALGDPRAAALTTRPETEIEIEAEQAAAILDDRASAAEVLRDSAPHAPLCKELARALAGERVLSLGSFRNERCRLGPVELPRGPAQGAQGASGVPTPPLVFELDRTEFPGGRVDREVEIEIPLEHAEVVEDALRSLWRRAGLAWRTAPSKTARFRAALALEGQRGTTQSECMRTPQPSPRADGPPRHGA